MRLADEVGHRVDRARGEPGSPHRGHRFDRRQRADQLGHVLPDPVAIRGRPPAQARERVREDVAKLVGALPAAEAVAALRGAGLAASAVNSVADLVREPHCWSRGDLVRLVHPEVGEIVTQGIVPSLSRPRGRVAGWSRQPGSDNEAVLGALLGYSAARIRELAGS